MKEFNSGGEFEVFIGKEAEEKLSQELSKEDRPENMSSASLFVDRKIVESEIAKAFDGKMTYGKLFKLYLEGGSLPSEIDDVIKFKKYYLDSLNENNDPRKAA